MLTSPPLPPPPTPLTPVGTRCFPTRLRGQNVALLLEDYEYTSPSSPPPPTPPHPPLPVSCTENIVFRSFSPFPMPHPPTRIGRPIFGQNTIVVTISLHPTTPPPSSPFSPPTRPLLDQAHCWPRSLLFSLLFSSLCLPPPICQKNTQKNKQTNTQTKQPPPPPRAFYSTK